MVVAPIAAGTRRRIGNLAIIQQYNPSRHSIQTEIPSGVPGLPLHRAHGRRAGGRRPPTHQVRASEQCAAAFIPPARNRAKRRGPRHQPVGVGVRLLALPCATTGGVDQAREGVEASWWRARRRP
jgi:hypothetical protein